MEKQEKRREGERREGVGMGRERGRAREEWISEKSAISIAIYSRCGGMNGESFFEREEKSPRRVLCRALAQRLPSVCEAIKDETPSETLEALSMCKEAVGEGGEVQVSHYSRQHHSPPIRPPPHTID